MPQAATSPSRTGNREPPEALPLLGLFPQNLPSTDLNYPQLQERLELELSSAYLSGDDDDISGKKNPVWGSTHTPDLRIVPRMDAKIRIELASEMLWPLLVPAYTVAEKATTSLMIASTLLHELAVRSPFYLAGP